MAQHTNAYSAGKFVLELDGSVAGFLLSVEGGEPVAIVTQGTLGPNGVVSKQRTGVQYAPIQISFGAGMTKAFYQWIGATLARNGTVKNGAIVFVDFNFVEVSRLVFEQGAITEVKFPVLDAANPDSTTMMTITIQPQSTRIATGGAGATVRTFSTRDAARWNASNFRLKITGLESACSRVNKIESIIAKDTTPPPTAVVGAIRPATARSVDIGNVSFTVAESSSRDFYTWSDDFVVQGVGGERSGSIEFLDRDMRTVLFTLTLSNVGLVRVRKNRVENGAEVIARVTVEVYCESLSFSAADDAIGAATTGTTKTDTARPTGAVAVTETLLAIINGKITAEDALRSALIVQSADLTPLTGTTQPELIAKRLIATTKPVVASPTASKREAGVVIGTQWATETATLDELKGIAALDGGDWTAVRLKSEHTLITHLIDAGQLPKDADESIDLGRDAFVEGIVFGAARVFRGAAQHLDAPALKA